MKTYTRTGDDGFTSLSGGKRITKSHVRVEAYGTIDELISWTGLLRDYPENSSRGNTLLYIQDQLMRSAASLASEKEKTERGICLPEPDSVKVLEKEIDDMEVGLKPLKSLILPGGNQLVSYCHISRCVCRRAERIVIKLNETEKVPAIIITFLNRLSDYFFILSRKLCLELDIEEVKWSV
jgi:cob(I)alamin adenosyltransferase